MEEKIRVIFNAFREHIVEVCDDKSQRDRYIVCPPTKKATLFTRVRVWTFRLLVTAIMACFRRTLSVEIMEFLEKRKTPSDHSRGIYQKARIYFVRSVPRPEYMAAQDRSR